MKEKPNSSSRSGMTRRKVLGGLLVGAGAVLSGLHMTALGQRVKQKGKYLLEGFSTIPRGLEIAVGMPLIEALHSRRARRFSLGAEIPDGPLKFKSKHAPMPLSELIWRSIMSLCSVISCRTARASLTTLTRI